MSKECLSTYEENQCLRRGKNWAREIVKMEGRGNCVWVVKTNLNKLIA